MKALATTLIGLLLLATAACGSGDDDTAKESVPDVPKVGNCYVKSVADGKDLAPDLTTKVACSKAHAWEIVGVHEIDKKFLSGKTEKQKLKNRDELATLPAVGEKVDKRRGEFLTAVWKQCNPDFARAAGVASVTLDGKNAKAYPQMLHGGSWENVAPPSLWKAGKYLSICSVFYHDDSGDDDAKRGNLDVKAIPVTSPDQRMVITHFLDSGFPVKNRVCSLDKDGKGSLVDCSKAHTAESVFSFDAAPFLSKSVEDQIYKRKAWYDGGYEQMRGLCSDAWSIMPKGTYVMTQRYSDPRSKNDQITAYCAAQSQTRGKTLPGGSVFGAGTGT